MTKEVSVLNFERYDKFLLIGDSITDCGRARPVGEGKFEALGTGYVALAAALLATAHPEMPLRIVNMGVSGDTIRDISERWQQDVIDQKPDFVSLMIGVNDVWRQFDRPHMKEKLVLPEEYEATLNDLVKKTIDSVKGLVLLSPFYMEPNRSDNMRKMVDDYSALVRDAAHRHGVVFVDTQAAMDRLLEHNYPAALGWDRVHPTTVGHMAIAQSLVEALTPLFHGR